MTNDCAFHELLVTVPSENLRDEPGVAGMPVVAGEHFHAEAELVFPVLRQHGDGVGTLHAEAHHVRVERRERGGVDADQLAVDVELEIVVGDHEAGDHLAVLVDVDDGHLVQVDFREVARRDLVALVVEVGKLRAGLEIVRHRHREARAVLGDDLTDRILADVHPGLIDRAGHEVLDRHLAEPLRDDALGRRVGFRKRQLRRPLRLLRLAGADEQRCRDAKNGRGIARVTRQQDRPQHLVLPKYERAPSPNISRRSLHYF